MEQKIKTFYNSLTSENQEEAANILLRMTDVKLFQKQLKKYVDFVQRKSYYYLITWTINKNICTKSESDVDAYIRDQHRRAPLQITSAYLCKEYTKKGVPHWHSSVITKTPLKKDRFNYYRKTIGNIDISKTKHNSNLESLNYISKSTIPEQLI